MTTKQFLFALVLFTLGVFTVSRADYLSYGLHGRLAEPATRIAKEAGLGQVLPMPQGRLTLTSHTPVMTSSVTSQTTIYYDAYVGNAFPIFNGLGDVVYQIPGNEMSMGLSATNMLAANIFDVWVVNTTGTPSLCEATNGAGGGWGSDTGGGSNTQRGTGYTKLDMRTTRSYITNANTLSNCFGGASGNTNFGPVPANQATYLGT